MQPADLKDWRKRLGLTQAEASSRIGISLRAYVTYEHGDRPTPRQTVLACRAIEAGLDDENLPLTGRGPGVEQIGSG